ncbi:hypothetical protein C8R48DRAFT_726377 [Suillus tomentosus]|nr:hypothetical protein C8R48DRAFT_726377 [Suillus tomentosus]
MSNTKSGSVEKQLPELPEDWKPPLGSRAQQTFAFLCSLILNQPNLEKLWREVEKETGWQEYNDRLHHEAIGLHVGQALVFLASMVCIWNIPHGAQDFDATSIEYCFVLLHMSSIFSVIGLLFQVCFFRSNLMIELCEIGKKDKKPFGLGRYDVLYHVGLFRMSQFCLAYSLASILGALSIILLGANYINSLIGVVTLGKFLDDFFMQRHVSLVCLLSVSVWFGIFAHSKFFT